MDIYAKLKEILKQYVRRKDVNLDLVTPETKLDDLGLDSLDKAEVAVSIEEEFGIDQFTDEEMLSMATVKDVKDLVEKKSK